MRCHTVLFGAALCASTAFASQSLVTNDTSQVVGKTYEYIIAGGGLTGLTVANKLAMAGHSVLVIEAGPNSQNVSAINNAVERSNITAAECNWEYVAHDANGTELSWSIDSGRCIGGGTSINGLVVVHPTEQEINAIEALGNPGWNWDNLFPYMKAIERNIPPDATQIAEGAGIDYDLHGFDGPIDVSFPTPMRIPEAVAFYKSAMETVFGVTKSEDLSLRTASDEGKINGSTLSSTSWTIWLDTISGYEKRSSAADAFVYADDAQTSNLTILYDYQVSKVLFDKYTATGVEFGSEDAGLVGDVYASKEVLLAAGTLGTPPILERSGVGDPSILSEFGITTFIDLPGVGRNMQDQPGTSLSALVNSANQSNTLLIDDVNIFAPVIAQASVPQLFGESEYQAEALALLTNITSMAKQQVAAGSQATLAGAEAILGAQAALVTTLGVPIVEIVGESYPTVMTSIFWPTIPFSRGWVHINSTDPFARPHIVPNLLTEDWDVAVALEVAKKAQSMFETDAFSGIISDPYSYSFLPNATDETWIAYIKRTSYGASHWIGSSAMLPRELGGVVDSDLQVYGANNLRVIDVSVFPMPMSAHSMPASYALAQRAGTLILGEA
ncbi:alcohol oxidase [Fistulina hepatica ATCC 64428]|uniref:Alcohol oxidase n=1 Tax=Fistulina hepatica ATCC 64428 TaxID=1128425 RepID=A0A0D7AKL3_9AGAR|nr:alcohol oxidase [Fistulina hepatica ATCC 64428]